MNFLFFIEVCKAFQSIGQTTSLRLYHLTWQRLLNPKDTNLNLS